MRYTSLELKEMPVVDYSDDAARSIVQKWFAEVGCSSNEPLVLVNRLGVYSIRCFSDGADDVATLMSDWSVELEAPDLPSLAALLERDLDSVAARKI